MSSVGLGSFPRRAFRGRRAIWHPRLKEEVPEQSDELAETRTLNSYDDRNVRHIDKTNNEEIEIGSLIDMRTPDEYRTASSHNSGEANNDGANPQEVLELQNEMEELLADEEGGATGAEDEEDEEEDEAIFLDLPDTQGPTTENGDKTASRSAPEGTEIFSRFVEALLAKNSKIERQTLFSAIQDCYGE